MTDVFATISEIVGFEMPADSGEDSFSLAPLLFGKGHYGRQLTVHHSQRGLFAIRKGDWKLILGDGSGGFSTPRGAVVQPGEDGPMQLYLLSEDPSERRNLVGARPDKQAELLADLVRIRDAGRSR